MAADSSLTKKLQIKPGGKLVIINPPAGNVERLGGSGNELAITPGEVSDFIQVFVKNLQELKASIQPVLKALKRDGLLWICYPKGSSKVKADLNRDVLWKFMNNLGFAGVSLISIDDVWSAMRLRPLDRVGK